MKSSGRRALRALILTLCVEDEFILSKIDIPRVIQKIEDRVCLLPAFFFFLFKGTLLFMEFGLPPLGWKIRRFSSLSLEKRLQYVESWTYSKVYLKRNLFKLIKAICLSHVFSEHELLKGIGYERALGARIHSKMVPGTCRLKENPQ